MLKSRIESNYEIHDCQRISQGDILRDMNFIVIGVDEKIIELEYQYIVVLSQDCDLEQANNLILEDIKCEDECRLFNQFLPSVLFVPAFPSDLLRSGEHIKSLYKIKAHKLNSNLWGLLRIMKILATIFYTLTRSDKSPIWYWILSLITPFHTNTLQVSIKNTTMPLSMNCSANVYLKGFQIILIASVYL